MIRNYGDFIKELQKAGFSGAVGGKSEGVFNLFGYGWGADDDVRWHTGNPDTDPWQWRERVMAEHSDIAYAKVFFKKAGYITREWYPYFLAARRRGKSFEDEYLSGTISHIEKRIYEAISENGRVPLHDIKRICGIKRESYSKCDAAINDLQMKMYITMCGLKQKLSQRGEEYGWASTMFCTAEEFWPEDVIEKADSLSADEAETAIKQRILLLNPRADEKKIPKCIKG